MNNLTIQLCASIATCALSINTAAESCVGDLNADHAVTGSDLGTLLGQWGQPGSGDLDGNGEVGGSDLGLLLGGWGVCPATVPNWATLVEAQPDPTVVTDPILRAAIVATGRAWRVRHTATQMEMLLVPPGVFPMGCIMGSSEYDCEQVEQPVHTVTLTGAIYLARYEVTQQQWQTQMGSNPAHFQGFPNSPDRPVEQVSWLVIQGFLDATGFQLPTEAEWEYACRAGTDTPFHNGSTVDATVGDVAWYGACCGEGNCGAQTQPVGGKAANRFGFHDMLGNVHEWVSDWYGPYAANAQSNPVGAADGTTRMMRGGSWLSDTDDVRSSHRCYYPPDWSLISVGFRVAKTP